MPAMGTGYGRPDGMVTDRLTAYLARRARGGAALIITEVCAIDPRGKGFPTEIGAWSDEFMPGLSMIADAVHREGSRCALQLHHAGRETLEAFAGAVPEAPSAVPSELLRQPCEEMTVERISEVANAYAKAAARARDAGFDAVEVHGAHGYLVGQFLSRSSNRRSDEYGGSEENRARFAVEVLAAVREAVGADFPVIIRVSAEEIIDGGYDIGFTERLAPLLVEAGADCIHASVGVISTRGGLTIATSDTEEGFNLPSARALKRVVDVPVIGVGRIRDPRLADTAISSGDADLVSFGRQHLADPDFLSKAREGRFEDIRWCLSCNQGCIERLSLELKPITCTINPECGLESEPAGARADGPLRVSVIGGGPAGLSAAMSAGARGHEVVVFERSEALGGQLLPASMPPAKECLAGWVAWASRMLRTAGVAVHSGLDVSEERLGEDRPDHVILATGALPLVPDIPGIRGDNVVDARALLLECIEFPDEAVIIGAGYVGMETADFLASGGTKVTLLEALSRPPVGRHITHGYWLHKRLRDSGGSLVLGATVTRIEKDTLSYVKDGQETTVELCGPVVLAAGALPETALLGFLEKSGTPHTVVGDAVSPRRLLEAVHEGYRAGRDV